MELLSWVGLQEREEAAWLNYHKTPNLSLPFSFKKNKVKSISPVIPVQPSIHRLVTAILQAYLLGQSKQILFPE